jgi:hypothetical protein
MIFGLAILLFLNACATRGVRQEDLDAWVGVSVEALDTHSLFLTLPMVRTITPSGIEVRNYPNKRNIGQCFTSGSVNFGALVPYGSYSSFTNCSSGLVGCDNIFYIKNGVVLEYAPTGNCYTDETVTPQPRYQRLRQ